MRYGEALTRIMAARGYTQSGLAERLGVSQPTVSNAVHDSNPRLNSAIDQMAVLGYEVALVPVGTRLPGEAFVVDSKGGGRVGWRGGASS